LKVSEVAGVINDLAGSRIAEVWRGVSQENPDNNAPMCAQYAIVKQVLSAQGDLEDVCGSSKRGYCEFHPKRRGGCPYRLQTDLRPPIWVVPHSLLAVDPPKAMEGADTLIIDERWPADASDFSVPLSELFSPREKGKQDYWTILLNRLKTALEAFRPGDYLTREPFQQAQLHADRCGRAGSYEWKEKRKIEIDPRTPVIDPERTTECKKHNGAVSRRAVFWRELSLFLESRDATAATMQLSADGRAIEIVTAKQIKPAWFKWGDRERNVVIMDATFDPRVAQGYLPGVQLVADVAISPGSLVSVRQVHDQAISHKKIVPGAPNDTTKPGTPDYQAQVNKVHEIMRAVEVAAYEERKHGGSVALVGPKGTIEFAETAWGQLGTRPVNLVTGHFNKLRGLNRMETVRRLVCVGRTQPSPAAIERLCRAVFRRHPKVSLGEGGFPTRPIRLRDKAGTTLEMVEVPHHPDPDCDALLRQALDAETLQAIHRARPVRRKKGEGAITAQVTVKIKLRGGKQVTWTADPPIPLQVDLVTNVPTDLPVNKVMTFDGWLAEGSSERLLLARGFVPSDWRGKAAVLRDLYPTPTAARLGFRRQRGANNVQTPNKDRTLIREMNVIQPPASWLTFRYRAAGERKSHFIQVDPDLHRYPRAVWEARLGLSLEWFEPVDATGRKHWKAPEGASETVSKKEARP
jgi:hypothetical protein